MNKSLDGSWSADQQTLAVQNAEAARFVLTRITPELDNEPWNTAVLRPLSASEPRPSPLVITTGPLPPGRKAIWTGPMFVENQIVPAIAYR